MRPEVTERQVSRHDAGLNERERINDLSQS